AANLRKNYPTRAGSRRRKREMEFRAGQLGHRHRARMRSGEVGSPTRFHPPLVKAQAGRSFGLREATQSHGWPDSPFRLRARAAFTEDGWFKTGDIGQLDAEGYLTITDRKKELLKTSGGKYIAPQPIEQLIKGSRFVNQVVVIGNGRKFPAALIVPDWQQLEAYAKYKDLDLRTRADFCQSPRIIDLFERQIAARTT